MKRQPIMPILVANGLRKSYRRRTVVHNVSFEVSPGEIVGLLGPNGAGKTTSFNMVVGLLPMDRGEVILNGTALGHLPLYKRARLGLGYLPQESTVFRGLSVYDNFLAVYQTTRVHGNCAKEQTNKLLTRFNLAHVKHNLGSELSGGERRRVEMARCLIANPQIILLDEPFAGVDPIAVNEIKGFIANMANSGIGVLVTDHNVKETLGICQRAYIISEGKILLSGSPENLVQNKLAKELYLGEDFSL